MPIDRESSSAEASGLGGSQRDGARAPDALTAEARLAALETENRALREQNLLTRLIRDAATDYAIITLDAAGAITSWSAGAEQIFGYREQEVLGRPGALVFTPNDRESGRFEGELRQAVAGGRAVNERWHVRRDGSRFWASGLTTPLLRADGAAEGFLTILRDRSEAAVAAEQRELLLAELNHRIKNIFSVVQAVADQTSRFSADLCEFRSAFGARLAALARSQDTLVRGGWETAALREVIENALQAHMGEAGRIVIEGVPVLLQADLVIAISLAFHELATNAVKYGALSVGEGRVEVSWKLRPGKGGAGDVQISWRERGGPTVRAPERRGFGSRLLEKGMPPGGRIQLDFLPPGLECIIILPLDQNAPRPD